MIDRIGQAWLIHGKQRLIVRSRFDEEYVDPSKVPERPPNLTREQLIAWAREVVGKPEVAAELAAVVAAMERRFGDDEVRRLRRGGRELHVGEETLSRVVGTESRGRLAHEVGERAAERQREAQQERLGLRQGRGMQM